MYDIETERRHAFLANGVACHNCQDMHIDFIPLIHETMGGSPWKIHQYAGTPKSLDNTMEALWQDSSQAEWVIKCHHAGCGAWNVPALSHDLMDMIGPWHRGISAECPGVVCATCAKPLDPRRFGRWVHAHPGRRWSFAGYHVPQIIMPMHYASQEAWDVLVGKLQGRGNTTTTMFLNEVCGESCDTGAKLVTETDLKAAAVLPWRNDWRDAVEAIPRRRYRFRVLAVDWGGGGGRVSAAKKDSEKRLRTSFTSLAALGLTGSGKVECFWGYRSTRTHDMEWEARLVVEAMHKLGCTHLAHDYSGAGEARLVLVQQGGFPPSRVVNVQYTGPAKHNIMNFIPADDDHPRDVYQVDKSRSLVLTCQCIKYGLLTFFEYDYRSTEEVGLLRDFLALQEEKTDSRLGTDVYTITRNPNLPDDFAQAVNIGCCTLWHMGQCWPDLKDAARFEVPAALLERLHPKTKVDWDDIR